MKYMIEYFTPRQTPGIWEAIREDEDHVYIAPDGLSIYIEPATRLILHIRPTDSTRFDQMIRVELLDWIIDFFREKLRM